MRLVTLVEGTEGEGKRDGADERFRLVEGEGWTPLPFPQYSPRTSERRAPSLSLAHARSSTGAGRRRAPAWGPGQGRADRRAPARCCGCGRPA